MSDTRSIKARLEAHGFKYFHMGGNLTAYVRHEGEVWEQIMSDEMEGFAPSALNEFVVIFDGLVDDEGEPIKEELETTEGYTMREVLAALDNPSKEYMLLTLRLYNDFHRSN